jgi:hypothetical protein
MRMDGRIFHLTNATTIRQLLEALLKDITEGKGERKGIRDKDTKEIILR